tara:strand:+ start:8731 stop:10101 length:1371 start_codon:yes stop_codon:yes gene_type:complete
MKRTAVINVVGLTSNLLSADTPKINAFAESGFTTSFKPTFPAVTCAAQSTYLTGESPAVHGAVANGWYDRDYNEVHFWKQSNQLIQGPKLWEDLKATDPDFTCAKLFWWYNMYSSADYSITPRPMYPADGRKIFDIYSYPMPLKEKIKAELGEFPFPAFWGPKAGIDSSKWIAESSKWIERKYHPTLNLIYLPHLDYNLQKLGPEYPEISADLKKIDRVVGELIRFFEEREVQVVLLSEYGITPVDRPVHLNRVLRQKGWISIKTELGLEQLDCGASQAFAVVDHQIAHIYVKDRNRIPEVRESLEHIEGVETVLDFSGKQEWGIDHDRGGDLIAIADERSWFTYYYWMEDSLAPDFARCVDIHRKPGYDPVELFVDPNLKFPAAKIAWFLIKKKLGFRALLDVIPLDATLVKGSHGRLPENTADWPVFISQNGEFQPEMARDIFQTLRNIISTAD